MEAYNIEISYYKIKKYWNIVEEFRINLKDKII